MAKIPHNTKAIKNARHFFILFSFGPPNYMFVDSHVHKRTYTRTLRIHCPTSPRRGQQSVAVGDCTDDRNLSSQPSLNPEHLAPNDSPARSLLDHTVGVASCALTRLVVSPVDLDFVVAQPSDLRDPEDQPREPGLLVQDCAVPGSSVDAETGFTTG